MTHSVPAHAQTITPKISHIHPASPIIQLTEIKREQWERVAQAICDSVRFPQVIGLVGTLGAGKTTLAQAFACVLGIDVSEVTSPTFTILQTHATVDGSAGTPRSAGRMLRRLHHFDAYRIGDTDEWLALGVEETMDDESSMTLIEWADRVADTLPPDTLWITIRLSDDPDQRDLDISGGDSETHSRLVAALADLA